MTGLLTDRSEINALLSDLSNRLSSHFLSKSERRHGGHVLWNYAEDETLTEYGLSIWYNTDGNLGLNLFGPSPSGSAAGADLLEFSVFKDGSGSRTPGALIRENGEILLCHSGRVASRSKSGSPSGLKGRITVGRNEYFIVSSLTSTVFFSDIVSFHNNRILGKQSELSGPENRIHFEHTEPSKLSAEQSVLAGNELFETIHRQIDGRRWISKEGHFQYTINEDRGVKYFGREERLGFVIEHGLQKARPPIMEFMIGERRSAVFLECDGRIWLAHTGRIHSGNLEAEGWPNVRIDRKKYYLVTSVYSSDTVGDMLDFFASLNAQKQIGGAYKKALDTGLLRGGNRRSCIYSARHSPIVLELEKVLARGGWATAESYYSCRPDLISERGDRKCLFEIKPSSDFSSLVCAIGQCEVYNREVCADRKIIIAPREPEDVLPELVLVAAQGLGIEIIYVESDGSGGMKFAFSERDELVQEA
jgi:hypothetical protein